MSATEVIAFDLDMAHHAHMFDDALFVAGYEVRHNILANRTEWRVAQPPYQLTTLRMRANGSRGPIDRRQQHAPL